VEQEGGENRSKGLKAGKLCKEKECGTGKRREYKYKGYKWENYAKTRKERGTEREESVGKKFEAGKLCKEMECGTGRGKE
jgi:hypothetical protein